MTGKLRFYFLDNLRVVAMALVIAHHAAMPYGPPGGMWPIQEAVRADVLDGFFTVNRSFGMSLFFMIAGYFTVMSCDRSGPRKFVKSRLVRLGIPLLAVSLVFLLLNVLLSRGEDGSLSPAWPIEAGHMWFVQHLLVYSLGYALWCTIHPHRDGTPRKLAPVPRWWAIVVFSVVLGFVSGVVRIWSPVDDWSYLLGFLKVAWADVPRDLSLFVLGAVAYRHQWVTRFSTRAGMAWLGAGLFLAAMCYAYYMGLAGILGLSQAAAGAIEVFWESLLCSSMCIGLTVLFRERANVQTGLLKWLAQAQYTAYVIHVFVVVGFQAPLLGLAMPPLAKFALVTAASVPATFLIAGLIGKVLGVMLAALGTKAAARPRTVPAGR
ncbi:MAG TPA: acyltransferase family protein [Anaerolineae bacterium]|nr:acyltransferase family protein [Anaerolineae bacterium]